MFLARKCKHFKNNFFPRKFKLFFGAKMQHFQKKYHFPAKIQSFTKELHFSPKSIFSLTLKINEWYLASLDTRTLFETFIFYPKIQLWFPKKLSIFWGWKTRCGFGLFSCWQLWFHEKNSQKKFGWKTCENVGILSKLNFWTKIWLFE